MRSVPPTTTILLVEDNEGDVRLLREAFAETGGGAFQIVHARRLSDAMKHMQESQFDVVLLDLSLPDSHGLDTITHMIHAARSVPVVVLTGSDDKDLAIRAVQMGAQDYLIKGQIDGALLTRATGYAIERQRALERAHHLAHHDALTGLPNRHLLHERLQRAVVHGQRYGRQFAVMALDLDRFKPINDTFGHEAGDATLRELAMRLQSCVRASDTVARVGGDEFVILADETRTHVDAETVAGKIHLALAEPFNFRDLEWTLGTSIGVALFPDDGHDAETLLRHADDAMYQAKDSGRDAVRFA